MKFADLHLHTNFSDGTFTPEQLVLEAQKNGLACIALTDHDTVAGCARAAAACDQVAMEFIPGTELTAEHDDTEVHVLGYFLDTQNPTLLAEIAKFQAVRKQADPRNGGAHQRTGRAAEGGNGFCPGELPNRPAGRMWRAPS